jgi:Pescadillo N-terminus
MYSSQEKNTKSLVVEMLLQKKLTAPRFLLGEDFCARFSPQLFCYKILQHDRGTTIMDLLLIDNLRHFFFFQIFRKLATLHLDSKYYNGESKKGYEALFNLISFNNFLGDASKAKRGAAKNYITRTQAVRRLQISLPDFRRLCIFKGSF